MSKWIQLPSEALRYQQAQMEFLAARRLRACPKCHQQFKINETLTCPSCAVSGLRVWDRLTIIAGRRFGKTRIGAIAAADEATIPNSIIWCCAPTDPKLERYVIPAMQQVIPLDWVAPDGWSAEYKDLRLKNGTLIHFQTLQDPDQGRGQGIKCLWIDEICELTKKHWEVIRPSLAGDTVAFFTTSPRGYDWVYEEMFHPAQSGMPGYAAWHVKTSQSANPDISAAFLARERAGMSDTMYRQEYEADFVIFTGAVYGNMIDRQVLRTEEEIKKIIPEWPAIAPWRQVLMGIDTGADHPFGGVKMVSTELGFVVVGDYLERHRSFMQHANALKYLAGSPTARWGINKNERQPSIELGQHGIYCQKAENDQIAGTERVKSWLQARQLWFVESLCPRTINQMRSYRYAENTSPKDDQKRKEKVFKLNDELPDCIRYALMTWPMLPKDPVIDTSIRDISQLPDEMRGTIERMRRLDGKEPDQKDSVVLDFWA